ncbi:MAG: ABC transporter permease [Faecalimonas sp.]|nr:ABC transporter permease [Faecalimonas sp.]
MKQFGKILKFELKYFFKNKVFVGVTIFLMLLIAGVLFFPRIQEGLTNEDENEAVLDESELPVMLFKPSDSDISEMILHMFQETFVDYKLESTDKELAEIKEAITAGEAECAFVLTGDASYEYYVDNLSMYDVNMSIADEAMERAIMLRAIISSNMTEAEALTLMATQIEGEAISLGKDQMDNYWYTYIMIFALYMVILLYGQMVATNVATEKSSRAMELLITSAKPVSMMFGKVLASCIAGLVQLIAVFGTAILCYRLNESYWGDFFIVESIFAMPPELFGYMLVFFVLGFLLYAFMFGAVGSTASKLEDINTSVMPITMLFIIGFLVVMVSFGTGDVDNTLMKICSYVPFTSSMAMFTRIAMSTVPLYEIVISIVILIASTLGIGVVSAKIYRLGVLMYGNPPKLGTILKQIWRA